MPRRPPLLCLCTLLAPLAAQNEGFDPPRAPDLDPDPRVLEVELVAAPALWEFVPDIPTEVWAYNGTIPGPLFEANVGDHLVVHFRNELPEPTTVHWHGMEIPAAMDGSHISQRVVAPGATFDYEFDLLRAGLFWYHPHVRTFDQVERGLYGVVLVHDPEVERSLGLDGIEEHVVVFDDILLDDDLRVVPAFPPASPLENVLYQLNGREGNHLLVNGKVAGTRSLTVENGKLHRWRVLNAANTTFCRLDLNADAEVPLWMIGGDAGLNAVRMPRPPVVPLIAPDPEFSMADRLHLESWWSDPPPAAASQGSSSLGRARGPSPWVELDAREPDGLTVWRNEIHSVPEIDRQGIFLTPGERMDVLFLPIAPQSGAVLRVFQFDWFRGRHTSDYDEAGNIVLPDDPTDGRHVPREFLRLVVAGEDPGPPYPKPPLHLVPVEVLRPEDAVGVLPVHMGHTLPDADGNVTAFVQAEFVPDGTGGTQIVPLPAPLVDSFSALDVTVGDTWIWEITNLSHGDHPFHTHGFFFQPYEIEFVDQDVPENNRVRHFDLDPTARVGGLFPQNHDTFRIPARPGLRGRSKTIVRALARFDDTGREGAVVAQGRLATETPSGATVSGGWLFHCHVLEHAALGMLSFFEVHAPGERIHLLGQHLPGSEGPPSLTGRLGDELSLFLVGARPGAPAVLVLGFEAARLPLAGGELVPRPDSLVAGQVDASGRITWSLPPGLPPAGALAYAQVLVLDDAAVEGLAFSNALSVELP